MNLPFKLAFNPQDWVKIKFAGVNYKGRVVYAKVYLDSIIYHVQYVDDAGTLKYDDFLADELSFDEVPASKV